MRLEAVTAELRPRSDWESVDLGFAMVRRDFWKLSGAWWLGMTPILAVSPLLFGHPVWLALLFLWWTPVASRLELFILSRRLFGESPGWRAVLREFPRAAGRRFFHRLVWARLSPWRPLTMAVEDLEGLRGRDYAARCRVLMRRGDSTLTILALWRVLLGGWMILAVFATVLLFLPAAAQANWTDTLTLWYGGEWVPAPAGMEVALMVSVLGAVWLVDLFGTGAGFGIYVNHRTWIEGWDVELAFRRLGERLRGLTAALAGCAAWFGASRGRAREAEEVAAEVLADPDFEIFRETQRTPVGWDWWDWSGPASGDVLGALGSVILFLFLGGVVGLLAWLVYRYRHVFAGKGGQAVRAERRQARVVMGMEVTPESLPDDVAASALDLWRQGRARESLGLLYRGGISWMIGRAGVEIVESDTERDCLRRVRDASADHAGYFDRLTTTWMALAYGRQRPGDAEVERLCGDWPFREGGAA